MTRTDDRGFTLIELMTVIIVLGLVIAFSIPSFGGYVAGQNLVGSANNIAGQLRLAREKAIATGQQQTFHIALNYPTTADYHMHNSGVGPEWQLPKNIVYYNGVGSWTEFRFTPDGRCKDSGVIIVQDHRSKRDTVSVQLSGLVTLR